MTKIWFLYRVERRTHQRYLEMFSENRLELEDYVRSCSLWELAEYSFHIEYEFRYNKQLTKNKK